MDIPHVRGRDRGLAGGAVDVVVVVFLMEVGSGVVVVVVVVLTSFPL